MNVFDLWYIETLIRWGFAIICFIGAGILLLDYYLTNKG